MPALREHVGPWPRAVSVSCHCLPCSSVPVDLRGNAEPPAQNRLPGLVAAQMCPVAFLCLCIHLFQGEVCLLFLSPRMLGNENAVHTEDPNIDPAALLVVVCLD